MAKKDGGIVWDEETREVFTPEAWEERRIATWKDAEKGDPRNRLIEIHFDGHPGPDAHSRQDSLLQQLFGAEDSITDVAHDDALLAASDRARAKLPSLRRSFQAGFDPGGHLLVKAPFATPDQGREWMWVEVVSWRGKAIRGILQNDPFRVPTLRAGQDVEIDEDDVFDYILRHSDGTQEGNETGVLIEALEAAGQAEPQIKGR